MGAELDALEADMGMETESDGMPSYLQPDKEPDLDSELNLPSAPSGQAIPAGRSHAQVKSFHSFRKEILDLVRKLLIEILMRKICGYLSFTSHF